LPPLAGRFVGEASIIGQTIRIDWLYPDSSTVYDTSATWSWRIGVEWFAGSGAGDIDVGNGTITIENLTAGWGAGSFNGFRFTDALGAIGAFTSFSLVSITGFAPPIAPALSFTADELLVNFTPTGDDNIGDGVGQVYTFAFTIGAVPVPSPRRWRCWTSAGRCRRCPASQGRLSGSLGEKPINELARPGYRPGSWLQPRCVPVR